MSEHECEPNRVARTPVNVGQIQTSYFPRAVGSRQNSQLSASMHNSSSAGIGSPAPVRGSHPMTEGGHRLRPIVSSPKPRIEIVVAGDHGWCCKVFGLRNGETVFSDIEVLPLEAQHQERRHRRGLGRHPVGISRHPHRPVNGRHAGYRSHRRLSGGLPSFRLRAACCCVQESVLRVFRYRSSFE